MHFSVASKYQKNVPMNYFTLLPEDQLYDLKSAP